MESNDEIKLGGNYFSKFKSLFLKPCDSKELGIYSVKKNCTSKVITVTTDDIKSKCLYYSDPNCDDFVVIPLLQYNN